ncbi:peptide ABC transporter permease [Mycolicibacterium moriokaense]|nr:peptide ABC transporter permease [Mycolicibacterium moriokaense]
MTITDEDAQPYSAVLRDEAFPTPDRRSGENSPRVLLRHTWVHTKRLLIRLARDPMTFVFGIVLPICFLMVTNLVLGDSIKLVTGASALYGSVPLVTLIGAMNGASVGVLGVVTERTNGLLARLWVVPVHRASGLLARIISDAVRIVANSSVLLCVGLILGMRLQQGWVAGLAWLCIPAIFGMAFATLALTVAMYWPNPILVEAITLVSALLLFFCTGFVPLDQYPKWIQPVVEHQPLSYATEAMRGLTLGGPVLNPLIGILVWSSSIIAVCAIPMVIGYRRASMRG